MAFRVPKAAITLALLPALASSVAFSQPFQGSMKSAYLDAKSGLELQQFKNIIYVVDKAQTKNIVRDFHFDKIENCSSGNIRCLDAGFQLTINEADERQADVYIFLGVRYTPKCISVLNQKCIISSIVFRGVTGDHKGEAGFYIYQKGFGVRSIYLLDPNDSHITADYTFKYGTPYLSAAW